MGCERENERVGREKVREERVSEGVGEWITDHYRQSERRDDDDVL